MINFRAIGQRIKNLRKENNLTQEKLAELTEISTEHLSRIETGAYRPSLSLLERIAVILGTDEQYLIFGSQDEKNASKTLTQKIECLSLKKKEALTLIIDLISD